MVEVAIDNSDAGNVVVDSRADIEEGAPLVRVSEEFKATPTNDQTKKTVDGKDVSTDADSHSSGNKHNKHGDHDDDGHGHHEPATPMSLLSSAVVCFVIYFVFCIVFSSVVWDPLTSATSMDENISPPYGIPQGVGINLMGIAIGSAFFAWKSGCRGIIAGPDLLPIVFFAEAGMSVMSFLASQSEGYDPCADNKASGYSYGESEYDDHSHRFLGEEGEDPCYTSDAYRRYLAGDEPTISPELIPKAVPTTLVAMIIGNLITALLFYGLGKMKNTASVIGFIPASVVGGFLTCIGYKVRRTMLCGTHASVSTTSLPSTRMF